MREVLGSIPRTAHALSHGELRVVSARSNVVGIKCGVGLVDCGCPPALFLKMIFAGEVFWMGRGRRISVRVCVWVCVHDRFFDACCNGRAKRIIASGWLYADGVGHRQEQMHGHDAVKAAGKAVRFASVHR